MNLVYLKKFNNYFNRKFKLLSTYDEYISQCEYEITPAVSFNPNDGVNTETIMNAVDLSFIPDYLLVIKEDDKEIVSRWFVMEARRSRNGQYRIDLRRDLLADYYSVISEAPIFVRRGNVLPDNNLIFNKEGNLYNQIKKREIALRDFTQQAWIVGYLANEIITAENNTISFDPTGNIPTIESLNIKLNDVIDPAKGAKVSTITNSFFQYIYVQRRPSDNNRRNAWLDIKNIHSGEFTSSLYVASHHTFARKMFGFNYDRDISEYNKTVFDCIKPYLDYYKNEIIQGTEQFFEGYTNNVLLSYEELSELKNMAGTIVKSETLNKYYRFEIGSVSRSSVIGNRNINTSYATRLITAIKKVILDTYNDETVNSQFYELIEKELDIIYLDIDYEIQNIRLIEVENPAGTWELTIEPTHQTLVDAPYSMFAIPFSFDNMQLANEISKKYSGGVYDIQILPYCPAPSLLDPISLEPIEEATDSQITSVKSGDQTVSYILWCEKSSNTFIIQEKLPLNVSNGIDMKVENETRMYRLVSPNYNGAFEFSIAKNGGVEYFEVSYTYKPYTPYIQVNPNFKRLYGSDFNDERGLICNGNFSIATTTDRFQEYEIQNKNYENIFNAQIKKMDTEFALSAGQSMMNAFGASAATAAFGFMKGVSPTGVAAGVTPPLTAGINTAWSYAKYDNNKRLMQENFSMNLQNVAARPDSLNKVSAYNINNKYFPFVEVYESTEEEVRALENKLKYEGMNIGVIGTMREFSNEALEYNFFAGSLIILEEIEDDYHLVQAIKDELERGFYI